MVVFNNHGLLPLKQGKRHMILKNDLLHVEFGSMKITHNGSEKDVQFKVGTGNSVTSLAKLIFDPTAVEGLEDVPAFRRNKTERPMSHGTFLENGRAEARIISLTGHAVAMNSTLLHALRSDLARHLNTGGFRQFKFSFAGGTRYATGSCDTGLTWTQELDHYARWKFDIYCPDPRLYGDWREQQMRSSDIYREGIEFSLGFPLNYSDVLEKPKNPTIQNKGNSEAFPTFTVNANTSGFKITNGAGKSIIYSGNTTKGSPVVIDTFTGRASVGGSDRSYNLTSRQWFTVPPGGSIKPTVDFVANPDIEADLQMTVNIRDTWI